MSKQSNVLSNLMWRFFESCGAQGVTFVISIVLARLLEPEIYGTIALVTVFTSILNVFISSGLGTALVQKKDADQTDFSTVFFFNVGMCIFVYLLLFFSAPFIALFYGIPELTAVVRVMGISLIFSGLRNIQQSYVTKHMLFKKFFYSTIGGIAIAGIAGIVLAYLGFGVWALIGQYLLNTLIGTIVLWFTVPWRPAFVFSWTRLKALFSFGWKMLASGLLDTAYNNLRSLIIGKLYSSSDLAFYNKGKTFPELVINNINSSIDSVLLPTMAKEQDDRIRVKAMTRRAIRTSTYIMAPMMVGLAVCAEPLIRLLLTDKWLDSVFFMRIFCISYMFYPIHTANLNAIKAMGRSDWFLKLEIAKKLVGLALVLATMFISVEAMACSLLLGTLLSTIINAYPNRKLLDYSWAEQMKDILPNLLLAVAMGVPVLLMQQLPLPTIVVLALQVLTGAVFYVAASAMLKLEIFQYLLNIIKGFMCRKELK